MKSFRNHLDGLITCSGENDDVSRSSQRSQVGNKPCNIGTNIPLSWKQKSREKRERARNTNCFMT